MNCDTLKYQTVIRLIKQRKTDILLLFLKCSDTEILLIDVYAKMSKKGKGEKRQSIDLETKYKVIKDVENKVERKTILENYGLKDSANITRILKNKEKIIKAYEESNVSTSRKHLKTTPYPEMDKYLINVISQCNSQGISVLQPVIVNAARNFAKKNGIDKFVGGSGHFYKFQKRNGIVLEKIHGEAGSVSKDVIDDWIKKLPELIKDYEPRNIFNGDELGLFYKLMPSRTYKLKDSTCKGGKKSKERITIFLCANMDGSEKIRPTVIGKFKKPRCFKSVDVNRLPVNYQANKRAWMDTDIFKRTLLSINEEMKREDRNILLFIDNCTAHPHLKFSNIKLMFLPTNSTSVLQPMDQGVIKCFKSHYRRRFLEVLISAIEKGVEVDPSKFTIYEAIIKIDRAWNDVTAETIKNCFRKCGFRFDNLNLNYIDIDSHEENHLWGRLTENLDLEGANFDEYINIDNNLVASIDYNVFENENAEVNLNDSDTDEETQESQDDIEDPQSNPPTFKETLNALRTIKSNFMYQGKYESVKIIDDIESQTINERVINLRQSKITDYFN